jgi:mannose-6-phosphate isomerase-like protein (cupin superfamily)
MELATKEFQMEVQDDHPIATSTDDWRMKMQQKALIKTPSFFRMRARLPKQGRTNIVLGATPIMSVVLKTYASGGENELHAHPYEDHLFVVLQGAAHFYGPNGEVKEVRKNSCALLPRGSLYRFHAVEGEPLVMLRVGAVTDANLDPLARTGVDGEPFEGYSDANKEVPIVLGDEWFD